MTTNQTQKFNENWTKNYAQYGTKNWEIEPDFAYYIQAEVPLKSAQKIAEIGQEFINKVGLKNAQEITPKDYYLTLTLPGRLGTHFQKNDIPFMAQTLEDICKSTEKIRVKSQNINCFPTSIFSEIHDPSDRLQQLHETLCNEIPFSQHPEFRYKNYLPHITIAHGGKVANLKENQPERMSPPIELELETISLGRVKWENDQLTKETLAQFKLQ